MSSSGGGGGSTVQVLSKFAASPTGFILGLVLTPLLNGVEGVVERVLWAINYVFFGHSRSSTLGDLGLVDVPAVIATTLIDAGSAIGEPVLGVIDMLVQLLIDFFNWTGPAGLLGAAIVFAIVVVAYSTYLRTAIEIALDVIPGGGAFIN